MAACSHNLVRPSGEVFVTQALPAGIQIEPTELEGPVFADASGRTLYRWPQKNLRNGNAGDPTGSSFCTSVKTTVNAGLMSPYPAGLVLPDLETRPACTVAWPPASVAAGAKPVGRWTIIQRKDGITQWAYDEAPLYTSHARSATWRRLWGFGPVLGWRRAGHPRTRRAGAGCAARLWSKDNECGALTRD